MNTVPGGGEQDAAGGPGLRRGKFRNADDEALANIRQHTLLVPNPHVIACTLYPCVRHQQAGRPDIVNAIYSNIASKAHGC